MNFDTFNGIEFPEDVNSPLPAPVGDFVYVICFVCSGAEVPFYVGETHRLKDRVLDYVRAAFAAPTDFNVGEAIKYLRGKNYRVVVRYKEGADPSKAEKAIIRRLLLEGARLLNGSPGYDYTTADEAAERYFIRGFCDVILCSQSEPSA